MTTYNKFIVNGVTKLDISNDSVDASKLLRGETAHNKHGAPVTGTCDYDSNTTDATATVSDMLAGTTAYVNKSKITGTMQNRGSQFGYISRYDQSITIQQGFHDGGGSVGLDADALIALASVNIKSGVNILGITGTYTGEGAVLESASATPTHSQQVITPSQYADGLSSVTVDAIPVTESPTPGTTGYTISI